MVHAGVDDVVRNGREAELTTLPVASDGLEPVRAV